MKRDVRDDVISDLGVDSIISSDEQGSWPLICPLELSRVIFDPSVAVFATREFAKTARSTERTAGVARSNISIQIMGKRSLDMPSLSLVGSPSSKFGDRAADINACERSSRPQIATSATALVQESTCMKKLLYGRYLVQSIKKLQKM